MLKTGESYVGGEVMLITAVESYEGAEAMFNNTVEAQVGGKATLNNFQADIGDEAMINTAKVLQIATQSWTFLRFMQIV